MARIPYVARETIPDGRADLYDRLLAERGPNPENICLAMANAPALTEAVLGMATALRKQTALPKMFDIRTHVRFSRFSMTALTVSTTR